MENPRSVFSFKQIITDFLPEVSGVVIADIGCGGGGRTRILAAMDAEVTGVEPLKQAFDHAVHAGGGASYCRGSAENTTLPSKHFDVVMFSNSLHHANDMDQALEEARRIAKPDGMILVLEPEAQGAYFEICHWLNNETEVYAQAQAAISLGVEQKKWQRQKSFNYLTEYHISSIDALADELLMVDPSRKFEPKALELAKQKLVEFKHQNGDDAPVPHHDRVDQLCFR